MTKGMVEKPKLEEDKEQVKVNASRRFGIDQSKGRLFFLILLSLALTNLGFDGFLGIGQYFGLLSFLAPVPLAMAILIYGRKLALSLAFGLVALLALGAWFVPQVGVVAGAYFFTAFYAFLVTVVIQNDVSPIKGVLYIGTVLVIILWIMIGGYNLAVEGGIHQYITQMVDASLKQVPNQKIDPKVLVDYIQTMGPIYITIAPFLALWACFFLVMRNSIFWNHRVSYSYSGKDMVSFRAPDYLIYPLAAGLALSLTGGYYEIDKMALIGNILLSFVGVFYFFQGFGVFLDSLNHFKIAGFMRSFLVVFVIILAQVWLAVLGVLDTWFDLRKFFRKKLDEGDI